ncbi:PriCT-2 domain-containing protein, partial [Escherichia coli]|nr:PriCT-2 domain-containing protein [Escherichia coli]
TLNRADAETILNSIAQIFKSNGVLDIKITGTSAHQAQVQASPQIEVTDEQWKQLPSIVAAIPNDDDRHWDDWLKVGFALRTCAGDSEDRQSEAFAIWEEYSSRSPKNDPDFTRH